jgi:hypothetical protein
LRGGTLEPVSRQQRRTAPLAGAAASGRIAAVDNLQHTASVCRQWRHRVQAGQPPSPNFPSHAAVASHCRGIRSQRWRHHPPEVAARRLPSHTHLHCAVRITPVPGALVRQGPCPGAAASPSQQPASTGQTCRAARSVGMAPAAVLATPLHSRWRVHPQRQLQGPRCKRALSRAGTKLRGDHSALLEVRRGCADAECKRYRCSVPARAEEPRCGRGRARRCRGREPTADGMRPTTRRRGRRLVRAPRPSPTTR